MDALMKPALPKCIRYSLAKTAGGTDRRRCCCREEAADRRPRRLEPCSYRAPVGYKVGKQTVIVASDFVLLRKGRTEIYINVTGPSNEPALAGPREADREDLLARVRA